MKILSRDFSLREKLTMSILLIIVLGLAYYFLVFSPINSAISNANSQISTLETEKLIINNKISNLEKMEAELDEILSDQTASTMPSYNAVRDELAILNELLKSSYSYSINVANVTRDGDQIRRDIAIQFTSKDFETTKYIVENLADCAYRTLISTIQLSNSKEGVTCSLLVTFYETMVGGVADSGLPTQ